MWKTFLIGYPDAAGALAPPSWIFRRADELRTTLIRGYSFRSEPAEAAHTATS